MKTLTQQSWKIEPHDEDYKPIYIDFERCSDEVSMTITRDKKSISITESEIRELSNIVESTKFIFKQ